jgi:hypothetical protein
VSRIPAQADIARHPGNSANTVVDPARARKPSPRPAAWTRARTAHYDPRRLRAEGETDMDGSGIIPGDAVRFDPGGQHPRLRPAGPARAALHRRSRARIDRRHMGVQPLRLDYGAA